jgi:hypothetical protein
MLRRLLVIPLLLLSIMTPTSYSNAVEDATRPGTPSNSWGFGLKAKPTICSLVIADYRGVRQVPGTQDVCYSSRAIDWCWGATPCEPTIVFID